MTLREEIDGLFSMDGTYLDETFPPEEAARIKVRWKGPLRELWEYLKQGYHFVVFTTKEHIPDYCRINPNGEEGLGVVWAISGGTLETYNHYPNHSRIDALVWDTVGKDGRPDKLYYFWQSNIPCIDPRIKDKKEEVEK